METGKTAVLCCYFYTLGALYRIRLVASLCHGILKAVNCVLLVGTLNFSG